MEFSCLGFRVLAPGNMKADQLDLTLCNLFNRTHQQELKSLAELQFCFDTFMRYTITLIKTMCFSEVNFLTIFSIYSTSTDSYLECCDEVDTTLCEKLKKNVREYFVRDNVSIFLEKKQVNNYNY